MITNNDWQSILQEETQKQYFLDIEDFLNEAYKTQTIYPAKENIYNALKYTSYQDTKVVILGQDPYHEQGQAHGLAFSVNKGIQIPPSLQNIYKELNSDCGCSIPTHGYLVDGAKQGVLLLNTVLTVEEHKANSHANIGWQTFTDEIIRKLNQKQEPVVYILWGKNAQKKKELITNSKHLVLESVHPSPLSAYHGFFESKPFSKANQFLKENNLKPIDWQIKE